jgi:hypothetical protein
MHANTRRLPANGYACGIRYDADGIGFVRQRRQILRRVTTNATRLDRVSELVQIFHYRSAAPHQSELINENSRSLI